MRDDDEIEEPGRYDLPEVEIDKVLDDINNKMKEDAGADFKWLTTSGVPLKMFEAVQDYTRSWINTLSTYSRPQSTNLFNLNNATPTMPPLRRKSTCRASKRISRDVFGA